MVTTVFLIFIFIIKAVMKDSQFYYKVAIIDNLNLSTYLT